MAKITLTVDGAAVFVRGLTRMDVDTIRDEGRCVEVLRAIVHDARQLCYKGDMSASDPADLIPPWPCQQLHGGRPPYIYQGCDPDTGLCYHEECNPANDDVVPNAPAPPPGEQENAQC